MADVGASLLHAGREFNPGAVAESPWQAYSTPPSEYVPLFLDPAHGILEERTLKPLVVTAKGALRQEEQWPDDVPFPLNKLIETASEDRFLAGPPFALPLGDVTLLYGDGGVGKSWLALQVAVSAALGLPFLGSPIQASNVLVLDFENSPGELGRRVKSLATTLSAPIDSLSRHLSVHPFAKRGKYLQDLEESVHRLADSVRPSLIIIDGWQAAFGGDPVDPSHVTAISKLLKRLAGLDRAVLVLTHVSTSQIQMRQTGQGRKSGGVRNIPPAGNRFVLHLARAAYYLGRDSDGITQLIVTKENLGLPREPISLRRVTTGDAVTFELRDGIVLDISGAPKAERIQTQKELSEEERILGLIRRLAEEGGAPEVFVPEVYNLEAKHQRRSVKTAKRKVQPIIESLVKQGKLSKRAHRNSFYVAPQGA